MSFLASDVLGSAAALLNDTLRQQFTDGFLLPYMNMAVAELNELAEQNNMQVTNATSVPVTISAGVTDIGGATGPALPPNLVEIQKLYERTSGTTYDYDSMTRMEFLPEYTVITSNLCYWAWNDQVIKFLGATVDVQVKIHFVASKLNKIVNASDPITVLNAQSFLNYRTAALAAEFSGENKTRADSLNLNASLGLDRFLGIDTKGRQAIMTRRRPFMASWKSRGGF